MASEEPMIRLAEAQGRLGVSKSKMSRIVAKGLFPTYKNHLDGRETLVRWSEVQAGLQPTLKQAKRQEESG